MHRRRPLASLALIAVVACQALLGVGGPAATGAQDDAGGVNGYSYTSPSFGYAVTWPAAREVRGESSGGGADALFLDLGAGTLGIVGTSEHGGDATRCLDAFAAKFATTVGIADLSPADAAPSRPIAGGDGVVFSLFTGTTAVRVTEGDGTGAAIEATDAAATVYVECRPLVAEQSVLAIAVAAPAAEYDAVAEEARPLLRRLDLEGNVGVERPEVEPVDEPTLMIRRDGESYGGFGQRIFADANDFWTDEFEDDERYYILPDLRAFDGPTETVCGGGVAPYEVGPFYCPLSQTVFLDEPMGEDFLLSHGVGSLVYIVAHEIGHHVQNQLGYSTLQLSVEVELQADCLAGAYFKEAVEDGQLDPIAFDVILPLAASIGDQERSSFGMSAHGMGTQRVVMLQQGFSGGREACGL